MKKIITLMALACMMSTLGWSASNKAEAKDRLDLAATTLKQIMDAPDKGVPQEILEGAKCIAVIPHLVKAGFVFGGEQGKGVATCRTKTGWSAPTFLTATGGSWGAQIGVEGVDIVMLFMTQEGANHLLQSKFKIGADASAAAGPVGRHASAGTDWKLNTEILTYSRAKGAFAGISLNGTYIRPDDDSITAIYGKDTTSRRLLLGDVPATPAATTFLNVVRQAKMQAKNSQ